MKVAEIMVKNVCSSHADITLDELALTMWNEDCGCVPLINEQRQPVGVVTDRDIAIASALQHKAPWDIYAHELSADKPLYLCSETDDVKVALELMQTHQIRRVIVVNDDGELAGIISMGDVLARTGAGKNKLSYGAIDAMMKSVSGHHAPMPLAV
jgi:CBS domain-containing protein